MPDTHILTGKFTKGGSHPSRGSLTFEPTEPSRHAADNIILTTDEVEVALDSAGAFSIELYATDDAGWSTPFLWRVRERIIDGVHNTYTFALTADTDLSSVTPA